MVNKIIDIIGISIIAILTLLFFFGAAAVEIAGAIMKWINERK